MISDSLFDDDQASKLAYSIWAKIDKTLPAFVDPLDILFDGHLNKFDAKAARIRERFFIMTNHKLYYKKSQNSAELKGYMDCQIMRLTGYPESDSAMANSQKYRIRFTHNLKYCELYARCEKK